MLQSQQVFVRVSYMFNTNVKSLRQQECFTVTFRQFCYIRTADIAKDLNLLLYPFYLGTFKLLLRYGTLSAIIPFFQNMFDCVKHFLFEDFIIVLITSQTRGFKFVGHQIFSETTANVFCYLVIISRHYCILPFY